MKHRVARGRMTSLLLLCVTLASSLPGCSVNVLETFGDTRSNEALYYNALQDLNNHDYNSALTHLAAMTGAYPARREVLALKASAYAGLCGLTDFLQFVQAISGMSTRLFPFLLKQFASATSARIDACINAEAVVTAIGSITQRTSDENMMLVLIEFAKIGNLLSYYTDASPADGVVDANTDVCNQAPVLNARPAAPIAGNWYAADLRELASGITLAMANITALGSSVNLGGASLTAANNACTTLATLPTYDFCGITDPSAFTATQLKGVLSMLKEDSAIGLGPGPCSGDLSVCNCP